MEMSDKKIKSGITETMLIAVASSGGVVGLQFAQGGIDGISNAAITALVTAAVPLALRVIHKKREASVWNEWIYGKDFSLFRVAT